MATVADSDTIRLRSHPRAATGHGVAAGEIAGRLSGFVRVALAPATNATYGQTRMPRHGSKTPASAPRPNVADAVAIRTVARGSPAGWGTPAPAVRYIGTTMRR